MAVEAVIFDWGGTLTPWHTIDHDALWLSVCTRHYPASRAAILAAAACAAERELWLLAEQEHRSATLAEVLAKAGLDADEAFLASYFQAWDPHTVTYPEVTPLLTELRRRGIRIGVLSNTMWPRAAHERIFLRDQVSALIDGAVYSSELPWTKPHPEAFRAVMTAIGISDPAACVFVGDRPYDDVHGAKTAGMRAVLVPNSDVPPFPSATPDAIIPHLSGLLPHITAWS